MADLFQCGNLPTSAQHIIPLPSLPEQTAGPGAREEEAHPAPRRNKPLQRELAFISFSRRKAALGGCVRACVTVFVSGQWEKGQCSRAARKQSAICPCREQFFLPFSTERNGAESRHPPVLGGNPSDFALPGRGSVGEGAGPAPAVKRSLHSRPIKAGKKPYQNPQILGENRSSSSTLPHAVWYLLPARATPGAGGGSQGHGKQHKGSQHGHPDRTATPRENQPTWLRCLSAHTLSTTRNLATWAQNNARNDPWLFQGSPAPAEAPKRQSMRRSMLQVTIRNHPSILPQGLQYSF